MPKFTDALRGYAFETLKRDGFKCRYSGHDGTASFANWFALSEDHLLPKDHPNPASLAIPAKTRSAMPCVDESPFEKLGIANAPWKNPASG